MPGRSMAMAVEHSGAVPGRRMAVPRAPGALSALRADESPAEPRLRRNGMPAPGGRPNGLTRRAPDVVRHTRGVTLAVLIAPAARAVLAGNGTVAHLVR
ncbi:hypothetical protein WEB32_22475 [Streptomyces netropsis]|uniref:Uncharacterized protein n=1 Tax=Streptomyces netropsis TaxID=55404 RepID=A0A7W7L970_STRNE|nr:hypothetical protein [Streptomyces netropsis]MBB4885953.1 hypothetical protein [Streptomyces netropsis]